MSSLEKKLMKIETPKDKYNNLTSKERQALYDLENDKNIVIKGADKGSAVVVWDRANCINEAEKQLGDIDVYDVLYIDVYVPEPLISTIHRTLDNNIRNRSPDSYKETMSFFTKLKIVVFVFWLFQFSPNFFIQTTHIYIPGRPKIS